MVELSFQLPVGFGMFQDIFHAPTAADLTRIILRWSHFVAGITWIGILYFFNLVNVNFMKSLDGPTKKIVVPELMPRALWYFRWGALVTVIAGLGYYAMYILKADVVNTNAAGGSASLGLILLVWIVIGAITWAIYRFGLLSALSKDGRILGVAVAILAVLMAAGIVWWLNGQLTAGTGARADSFASNKTFSIGIGGALGLIMLLNVWGVIWPAQKRIIAATAAGTPPDAALARLAFLASRTNAWLSLPMLFFMATSHGDYIILGK